MPAVSELSAAARSALAAAWLTDAGHEHASVPAFSRISMMLVALGAPSRLVEAAHRAALEEIEHARRTFALASAYAQSPIGPGPLPELLTETCSAGESDVASAIRQLAVESLVDGCLGEGYAAAVARESYARAVDPAVRVALVIIARDESSHAELAWQILAWCLEAGGEETRAAIHAELRRLPRRVEVNALPSEIAAELERHGRLHAAIQELIFNQTRAATLTRASLMLDQQAPRPEAA
jgi:hypothetical protein